MQNAEMILDSHLEVLKDKILHQEDCERILAQIGQICKPKYVPCKIVPVKSPNPQGYPGLKILEVEK